MQISEYNYYHEITYTYYIPVDRQTLKHMYTLTLMLAINLAKFLS